MTRPNIIIITSHDVGQHLRCYGVDTVQTPHLDALAAAGVRCARSFCTAPQCSPSRASIHTGRYPHSNGVMGLTHGPWAWDLYPEEQHLAQLLRAAGYETFLGSYQHECRRDPAGMGFHHHLAIGGTAPDMGRRLGEWLYTDAPRSTPFYLQISMTETHRMEPADWFGHWPDRSHGVTVPPYLVDDYGAREEFALFQGAVKALDDGVGLVLESLEAAGLAENTLVMFVADHGIPFPRAKCTLYDPGIEVACLLRWPAGFGVVPGTVCEHLLSNVDYLPTLLELIGAPIPANVQGRSFASYLRGEAYQPCEAVFAEMTYHNYFDPRRAIRTHTYKLIANFTCAPFFMDSSQCWRPKTVTRHPENPEFAFHEPLEMYDLLHDPLETENLAYQPAHQASRDALLRQLHAWMVDTQDPLLTGLPISPTYTLALTALQGGPVGRYPEEICG